MTKDEQNKLIEVSKRIDQLHWETIQKIGDWRDKELIPIRTLQQLLDINSQLLDINDIIIKLYAGGDTMTKFDTMLKGRKNLEVNYDMVTHLLWALESLQNLGLWQKTSVTHKRHLHIHDMLHDLEKDFLKEVKSE